MQAPYSATGGAGFGRSTAQKAVRADRKDYEIWKKQIGGDFFPKTVAEYRKMQYNNSPEFQIIRNYVKSVDFGMISPLSGYANYKRLYDYIEDNIVGITTPNGIKVAGQSKHFMERIIGTMKDPSHGNIPRSGVKPVDVLDALLNGESGPIKLTSDRKTGKFSPSQLFYTSNCSVSINPETGFLIQCNP
ncbi:MAG: hypothetical protein IKS19_00035 [Clostridia bacterium]|nr:hypothetical protein [Clostridia bacterium]